MTVPEGSVFLPKPNHHEAQCACHESLSRILITHERKLVGPRGADEPARLHGDCDQGGAVIVSPEARSQRHASFQTGESGEDGRLRPLVYVRSPMRFRGVWLRRLETS